MIHIDLFSGVGGFSYAVDQVWEGVEHVFVENDSFCNAVLRKHWPNAYFHEDIETFKYAGRADLLTGGFPCQSFSQAGKRLGTADARWLWPEMYRVIRETSPKYIVAENVRGLLNIEGGVVFETVCTDLEDKGYEVQPFVIPACGKGAAHRRDRVWIIAHDNSERREGSWTEEVCRKPSLSGGEDVGRITPLICRSDLPTPELCRGGDGISKRLDALGNAIVTAIAVEIFKAIREVDMIQ